MQSLAETKAGDVCTIKCMFGVAEDMARFDIFEGSLIRVLSRIGDGVIIAKDNIRLAIGGEAAERIKV